jgi:exopolysaccharide biosynthesis protein
MDVVTTWAAGDPLLIQHGELLSTQHDWVNGKYPRTAIGMIKPCDYYILTAGSGGYKGGLTFDDVQAIYNDLGCEYARTFDGGGSSTLAFDTGDGIEVLNRPAGGSERPVADIFGISD